MGILLSAYLYMTFDRDICAIYHAIYWLRYKEMKQMCL